MARTSSSQVIAVLGGDYDGSTSLTPSIDAASAIVDRVVTCATSKGIPLTDAEAELVERWLAGHMYQAADPGYSSRSTLNKSGAFLDAGGEDLRATRYGKRALLLDPSGCLNNIDKRNVAGGSWLGKTLTEQLSYADRNGAGGSSG